MDSSKIAQNCQRTAKISEIFIISLNFLRTGAYYRSNGYLYRYKEGAWWHTAARYTNGYAIILNTGIANSTKEDKVTFSAGGAIGNGYAIRCVVRAE